MNSFRNSPASPTSVASRHLLPAEGAGWRANPCTDLNLPRPPTRFFIGEEVAAAFAKGYGALKKAGGGGHWPLTSTSGNASNKTSSGPIAQCA